MTAYHNEGAGFPFSTPARGLIAKIVGDIARFSRHNSQLRDFVSGLLQASQAARLTYGIASLQVKYCRPSLEIFSAIRNIRA